ncbi:hypothetical protein B0H16DRAFT_1815978 [Mycena metata]|uniref:Uncharacterized protein n=1 Tax=Mycena metata TaxID=1033252 RepID=A0AAD7H4D3_9AGAR|nr:hypothetical protein B0H16DRAFT_1815978 [Mycena metata]
MPFPKKRPLDSDSDYQPTPPKRLHREAVEDILVHTSSAPTSPGPGSLNDAFSDGSDDEDSLRPLPDLLTRIVGSLPTHEPSTSAACTPPRRSRQRAASESPAQIPSPATSTIFEATPVRTRGGRPRAKQPLRHSRTFNSSLTSEERDNRRSSARAQTAANTATNRKKKADELTAKKLEEAEARALAEKARKREKAAELLEKITTAEEDGGAGFSSLMDFFETITAPGGDAQASANVTRFLKSNGLQIVETIFDRVPAIGQEYFAEKFDERLEEVLQQEGKAIQELLTRERGTRILELLEEFSMEQLGDQLQEVAPTLWRILETTAIPDKTTRREEQGEARRQKRLVFTTACAMLSISRSQLANNYQVVIGLFLLASGASKREMEVLAHAGLSTSYNTISSHIK